MTSVYNNVEIFFNDSLETFPADLAHAKVTAFISVPRLWTKFRAMVLAGMPDEQLQAVLKTEQGPAVAAQIRAKLGLAECKFFGSGTAPISGAILQWFENLGMPIEEGWGMTELTGLACNNAPYDKQNLGTIGTPCPGFDIKLSDAGEIQIKGPAVFEGYYLNDEVTEASFEDGWFKTGDLGEFTDTGALKIVGRVKEQFKTAKGKYVSPVPIESKLSACPLVEQVCVVGSGMPQPLAPVVLGEAGKADIDGSLAMIGSVVDQVNGTLESHEKLDGVIVTSEDWSIESGLLTPTLKLQRTAIEKKYIPLWDNKTIKGVHKEADLG
jgi:long-subunit acyl-CoA synthetase (AMP-forming)